MTDLLGSILHSLFDATHVWGAGEIVREKFVDLRMVNARIEVSDVGGIKEARSQVGSGVTLNVPSPDASMTVHGRPAGWNQHLVVKQVLQPAKATSDVQSIPDLVWPSWIDKYKLLVI